MIDLSKISDNFIPLKELQKRIRDGQLFWEKKWRWSPRPYFLKQTIAEEIDFMGNRLLEFIKACELLYRQSVDGRQPPWIADLLDRGKPKNVIELGRHAVFRGQIPRIIRPDLIVTEEGCSICELDQIPGGVGLTAWLNENYSSFGFNVLGGSQGMLEGFSSILPGGEIIVSEEASTYRPEMEWIASRLNVIKSNLHWGVRDGSPRDCWNGNVYRFFEMFDLPNVPCASGLLCDALQRKVLLTPPPKAQLEEKLWMALFWIAPLREFWLRQLGKQCVQWLQRWIPFTWILEPNPLPAHAVYPKLEIQNWMELVKFSQKQRALIIKISGFDGRAWGSRGVFLGSDLSRENWENVIKRALQEFAHHPYILQVFRRSMLNEQPYYDHDGAIVYMQGRTRLSPYFFVADEKASLGGVLATVCPSDKKILHGMSEAIIVPTMIDPTT